MFQNPNTKLIIIIIIILVLLWLFSYYGKSTVTEYFCPTNNNLENYFVSQSDSDLKGLTVDTMKCHKSCCGNQWYTPFDGLTSKEIVETIAMGGMMDNGPFVRTNYTCANGDGGVGCPCIPKKAYFNLVNRGQSDFWQGYEDIEPTFHVGAEAVNASNNMTPKEYMDSRKSIFVNDRKLNDLELQRRPQQISDLYSNVDHPLRSHGVANLQPDGKPYP